MAGYGLHVLLHALLERGGLRVSLRGFSEAGQRWKCVFDARLRHRQWHVEMRLLFSDRLDIDRTADRTDFAWRQWLDDRWRDSRGRVLLQRAAQCFFPTAGRRSWQRGQFVAARLEFRR